MTTTLKQHRATAVFVAGVLFAWMASLFPAPLAANLDESIDEEAVDPDQWRKEKAREFFGRGSELFNNGQYLEAARQFEKAYAVMPNQAVLANIALCLDNGGDIPGAVVAYRKYLEAPIDNQPNARMRSRLEELEAQVGELDVVCLAEGCEVRIDKIPRETDSGLFVFCPGTYLVEGVVDGEVVSQERVTLKAGGRIVVRLRGKVEPTPVIPESEIKSAPAPVPPAPASVPVQQGRKISMGAPFWTTASIALVAGVATAVLGGATLKKQEAFLDSGRTDKGIKDMGENLKVGTNVALAVTGLSAVLATVFAVLDLKKNSEKENPKPLSFTGGPGTGVGIHGHF